MKAILFCLPVLVVLLVIAGCNNSQSNNSISVVPPGFQEIGVEWDGTGGAATHWFMGGFASSPGGIIEAEIAGATTAAQAAQKLRDAWNAEVGTNSEHHASLCGESGSERIVMLPENNVGYFAVLDANGTWRPITDTVTYVTLSNGLKIRKKAGPCQY